MKIKQDEKLNKAMVIFGVIILIVGLIILVAGPSSDIWDRASSLCTGLGFGAICGGLGGLYGIRKLRKDPAKFKQIEVERKDERNTFIKCKAKAMSGEIINWMVIIIAYVCIVMNAPSWTTMSLLAIFILKYIFEIILANQYAKKF
ncbi:hypothetical protein [Paraclostridium dentum]|uniref:hypothetical protein n=1 Tax=Paraclostridium dentum TaxID=2662455 RepID=UPI003AFFC7F4